MSPLTAIMSFTAILSFNLAFNPGFCGLCAVVISL